MTSERPRSSSAPLSAPPGTPAARTVPFRHLLLFDAVARLGRITSAARECGLSQPAATHALGVFQARAGFAVVEGRAKGTALTERGRDLHQRIAPTLGRLKRSLARAGIADPHGLLWRLPAGGVPTLEALVAHGSLERAALATAQPRRTVQRRIRELEALTGFALVDARSSDGTLGLEGAAFARQIAGAAEETGWAMADVAHAADRSGRTIVIGVANDPGTASLNRVVIDYLTRYPTSSLEIVEVGQDELTARLAMGEIDLLIGHIPDHARAGVTWQQLRTAAFRVAAAKDHPLAGARRATLDELAALTWLLGARGSQRRAASDSLFAGRAQPNCALVTSAAPMMAQIMIGTSMVALMTDQELAGRTATLCALAYDLAGPTIRIGLALRSDWVPSPLHLELIEAIKASFAPSP